jgi:SEC-C motif-containing protein
MMKCPCGLPQTYDNCCGRFISNQLIASTPEQLMRSRYSAYVTNCMDYIQRTMKGKASEGFDAQEAAKWSNSVYWLSLNLIKHTQKDQLHGQVEFIVSYQLKDNIFKMHEKSDFIFEEGRWFYIDGKLYPTQVRKLSANQPCYCHSGKKFKNCHMNPIDK